MPYAAQLVLEEIKKIREEPVTDEELDTIKRNLIETFPSNFDVQGAGDGDLRRRRVHAAATRRYWQTYRDRIRAVTAADVQRVAQKHLAPEKMVDPGGGRPEGDRPRRRQAPRRRLAALAAGRQGRDRCRCATR